ncbi:MAG: hypothetical protein AAEF23_02635 [Gammaproteobacteria bacterium]
MKTMIDKFQAKYLISCLLSIVIFSATAVAIAAPTIDIINYSKISTASLEKWTKVGTAKFSDWQADTLGVIWDFGQFVNDRFIR